MVSTDFPFFPWLRGAVHLFFQGGNDQAVQTYAASR
jgi:hypothetical protein